MTVDNPLTPDAASSAAPGPGSPAGRARGAVPDNTGSRITRILGIASLVGLVALVVFGLFVSPADAELGETIRILYMHVPTVSAAYLAFAITAGRLGHVPLEAHRVLGPAGGVRRPRSACCSSPSPSSTACSGARSPGVCSGAGSPDSPPRPCCS